MNRRESLLSLLGLPLVAMGASVSKYTVGCDPVVKGTCPILWSDLPEWFTRYTKINTQTDFSHFQKDWRITYVYMDDCKVDMTLVSTKKNYERPYADIYVVNPDSLPSGSPRICCLATHIRREDQKEARYRNVEWLRNWHKVIEGRQNNDV